VRAETFINGWYIEEHKTAQGAYCEAHYLVESDLKLSRFIPTSGLPNSTNYAYKLKKYVDKLNQEGKLKIIDDVESDEEDNQPKEESKKEDGQ